MRRMCALLAEELLQWPGVNMRPMFGMRAVYHGPAIFALLADKRALENPRSIGYKQAGKWKHFEMDGEQDISKALALLEKAYSAISW